MKKSGMIPLLLPCLMLSACRSEASQDAQTPISQTGTVIVSADVKTETAPPVTAPVQAEFDPGVTITVPQPKETSVTLFTVPEQQSAIYQGGEGDEAHGETPEPQYFTYRFLPDGVSVRLAGGTYQILRCDLSQSLPNGADSKYQLEELDFNGYPDLFVPVLIDGHNITYAAYRWDPERAAFAEPAFLLENPVVDPDLQQITCLSQDDDTLAHISIYKWDHDTCTETKSFIADYTQLTLTEKDGDQTEQMQFQSEAELSEALLQHRHG